jgi:hypothetical protein
MFTSPVWRLDVLILALAVLAGFMVRQPAATAVKIISGRKSKHDLPAAIFWNLIYSAIGAIMVGFLIQRGFGFVLWLAVPGVPVFIWHLFLIYHREERGRMGVEIVASGVLSLSAPGAYWVNVGYPAREGWWLFGLIWFQSAASIVYAYLRLSQRTQNKTRTLESRLRDARRALLYTSFNLAAVGFLAGAGTLPWGIFLPYLLQWGETVWGTLHTAADWKPTRIGVRQLVISILFTILFIISWRWTS